MTNDSKSTRAQTRYFGTTRPDMLAYVPLTASRVLEIGCGFGNFGAAIKKNQSAEVWGVEPLAAAAEAATGVLDRVLTGTVEEVLDRLPDGYFDCLVCNDVLEHLVDPWTVLSCLRSKCSANAVLVASIPNVRHHKVVRKLIWPGRWDYVDSGILDRTHLRFFTRASAVALVASSGFAVTGCEGINIKGFPAWLKLVNLLLLGILDDMKYQQFAIVGQAGDSY
jgi:2-polyprenyl-3-methyl-5-hydroxy-6-metoxy-1,4-benzoquinol methylase